MYTYIYVAGAPPFKSSWSAPVESAPRSLPRGPPSKAPPTKAPPPARELPPEVIGGSGGAKAYSSSEPRPAHRKVTLAPGPAADVASPNSAGGKGGARGGCDESCDPLYEADPWANAASAGGGSSVRILRGPPGILLGSSGDRRGTSRSAPGASGERPMTRGDLREASGGLTRAPRGISGGPPAIGIVIGDRLPVGWVAGCGPLGDSW